jgi:putative holliday junction resolvase
MTISRILGIDYGSAKIGLALSDPLKMISKPFQVIRNKGEETIKEIEEIVKQKNVEKIVLGLPLDKDGSDSAKTEEVRNFAHYLSLKFTIPIILWDERYTTCDANSFLKEIGIDYKKSKEVVDKIAASIILKDYLESL